MILGITFKENCPDIRNTRVVDIIAELNEFGIETSVFDPWADASEVAQEYSLEMISDADLEAGKGNFSAVIHAVAHKEFSGFELERFVKEDGVVFDVKSNIQSGRVDERL